MKVILSGGGTGGHIYPAVSVAKEIKKRDLGADILFIGTEQGLESSIVPQEGFRLGTIKVRGLERKLSVQNVIAVQQAFFSIFSAMRLIRTHKPDIVIGTGGYVSGSVVLAAAMLGIPTIIHEQNAFPGMTNKILSRFVDLVAVNFQESAAYFPSQKKIRVTGNPIREDILHVSRQSGLKAFGFREDLPVVFVVGGSRGAKKINESVLLLAENCIRHGQYQMLHMTGDTQYRQVCSQYESRGIALDRPELKVVPYLHNMPHALAASSIAISRCGASTLSEITALGKPSVLIPFPFATDNHQEYNARALEKNGAAVVILERDLNEEILYHQVLNMLSDPLRLTEMAQKSKALGKNDAAGMIADEAFKLTVKT